MRKLSVVSRSNSGRPGIGRPGIIATGAACVILAGCTSLAPRYERPAAKVPPLLSAQAASDGATPVSDAMFVDTRLKAVIAQANANNQDLTAAIANAASARAAVAVARAAFTPSVSGTGGAAVGGGSGRTGGDTTFSLGIGLNNFEIDLFGRQRNLSAAAYADYLATESGVRAARIALIASTAQAWLTYGAQLETLAVTRKTIAAAEKSVRLTSARLKGGIAPRTDLRQAETLLYAARENEARLIGQLAQTKNALDLLAGGPVAASDLPAGLADVARAVAPVAPSLDSRILLNRPDVIAAEQRLRASNARIGAARAAFFPRISLTSAIGLASRALTGLFSSDALSWSVSPGFSAPFFDNGAIQGNVDIARTQRDAALANYQATIQAAFRDTSDALARAGTLDAEERAQFGALASARDNANLSNARYSGGLDSYLAPLVAQRTLYQAERDMVGFQLEKALNRVALFSALGGTDTPPPADR